MVTTAFISDHISLRYFHFLSKEGGLRKRRSADIDQLIRATAARGSGPRKPAFCMTRYLMMHCTCTVTLLQGNLSRYKFPILFSNGVTDNQLSSLPFHLLGYLVDRLTVFGFGLMNDKLLETILIKRSN
jgi:hypothetical protein